MKHLSLPRIKNNNFLLESIKETTIFLWGWIGILICIPSFVLAEKAPDADALSTPITMNDLTQKVMPDHKGDVIKKPLLEGALSQKDTGVSNTTDLQEGPSPAPRDPSLLKEIKSGSEYEEG